MGLTEQLSVIIAAVRGELAPDVRTSVFEVEVAEDGDAVVIVGATSEPAAAEALERRIGSLDAGRPVRVEIARLPFGDDPAPHALVTSAVAPMQAGPYVSDAHVSQTLLGHRLMVLREHGRWLQCRAADGYLGWIHRGYVKRVGEMEARQWEAGADGEMCVSLGARIVGDDGHAVLRLPWGARVTGLGDGVVRLPDGREGRVEGTLVAESERERRFPARGEEVVATARRWMGAPYVWGGITWAGVDCSGLVQVVMRTHGIELPRDSDLQAQVGEPLEPGRDFSGLRPGDLLYFAEEAGRITHVALSMGGSRILHASIGNGGVDTNDLNGDSGFEEELRRLFVCARRVLPSAVE